jgi:hypothetical protein
MEESKMNREQMVNKFNLYFLFFGGLFYLILFLGYVYSAPNSGSEIVSWARAVIGAGYEEGKPANAPDVGYGIVWASPLDTSKFDCAGLVSYAAGLRRRYTTSELKNNYFDPIGSWDSLLEGDILHTNGVSGTDFPLPHVMIFVKRYIKDGITRIRIIHAGSQGVIETVEPPGTPADFKETTLKEAGFSPYRFKPDAAEPTVSVSGIEDGKAYNTSRTVSFSVSDNVVGSDFYAYAEQPPYSGNKFKSKTFSTEKVTLLGLLR